MSTLLLDPELIAQIRMIERVSGRDDMLSGLIRKLETSVGGFSAAFADYAARGDKAGAERAAHTLKGACLQLGAQALGGLFADIERSAKAGDYAEAQRAFAGGAALIAESLEALKKA